MKLGVRAAIDAKVIEPIRIGQAELYLCKCCRLPRLLFDVDKHFLVKHTDIWTEVLRGRAG